MYTGAPRKRTSSYARSSLSGNRRHKHRKAQTRRQRVKQFRGDSKWRLKYDGTPSTLPRNGTLRRLYKLRALRESQRFYNYMYPNTPFDEVPISTLDIGEDFIRVSLAGSSRGSSGGPPGGRNRGLSLIDIKNICFQRYGDKDQRVIVIVLARYSIESVRKMVKENYEYWHKISKNEADFYWLGYYLENSKGKVSTPFRSSPDSGVYNLNFDIDTYVDGVTKLNLELNKRLGHVTGYLLCNYFEGKIHFEKSVLIQIDELLLNDKESVLRKVTDCLFDACQREREAKNAGTIIKNEMHLEATKEKMGDFISGVGLIMQVFGV